MRRDDIEFATANGGDRPSDPWVCARLGQGDSCQFGPNRSGRCPLADQCRPRRTWAGRKRQLSIACLLAVAAIIGTLMWMPSDTGGSFAGSNTKIGQAIKPGELTTHHSQILATTSETDRCILCHPSTDASLFSWVPLLGASAHDDLTQTDLCLNCHKNQFAPGTASLAHNLPAENRNQIRLASAGKGAHDWRDWLPSPEVDQENLACSVCHREHRGPSHNLTALSDAQCQTCHQDRFGAFATSHPEFVDWPYGRGGTISFNHQSHQNKHFPESKQETANGVSVAQFQCALCHQPTADGRVTRAVNYQSACATCHDESLQTEVAEGIELVSIPTLPREVVADLPAWPSSATGFFDGKLSPLAQLLIRGDEGPADLVKTISGQDFSRVDPDSAEQVQASKLIASQLYRLLVDLSERGQSGMLDRFNAGQSAQNRWTPVVQSFSPQLIDTAMSRWFDQPVDVSVKASRRKKDQSIFKTVQYSDLLDDELLAEDDLLDDDLLSDDLLSDGDLLQSDAVANQSPTSRRFDADEMLIAGGWYRDDIRLAIRYRASGHADPVLKATIEAAASLPQTDIARQGLMQNAAVSACLRCHASASQTAGSWRTHDRASAPDQFTTFSHGPHLNIATLSDCVGCHRVKDGIALGESITNVASPHHPANDFDPIRKQDCSSCHTAAAAGDSCVGCHRYHIDVR